MTITLTFRKTNQADPIKSMHFVVHISIFSCLQVTILTVILSCQLLAYEYDVYPQPETPHCCCYTKLDAWLKWMAQTSRFLQAGDIKLRERFSQTRIQSLLDKFHPDANLLHGKNGRFTTHCFRRGGAQYRFMFTKEKWSLKAVKWWGEWSEGEGTGTIMRYLLDDCMRHETSFRDMLYPRRNDGRHTVFMGESELDEGELTTKSMMTLIAGLGHQMHRLKQKFEQQTLAF